MPIENEHPYWHVRALVEAEPIITSLELSYYVYRPQSLIDERSIISISRNDFLDDRYVQEIVQHCPMGHDLAIHSMVKCMDDVARHIPMVDMSTNSRSHLLKLKAFLDEQLFYGFAWFDSGRSFHGYGSRCLNHTEWIAFMGQLLLSNQKDLKPTVDPRWIGHRLIAGYAALRWTKNTDHYLRLPVKIPIKHG